MLIPELITSIREDPEKIFSLQPREFEELIAELLASMGWEISLTSPTRAGGYDILGISRDATGIETTWAVECKRYGQDRPVGVNVLRELYAVKTHFRIPQALLVTTSRVTADAKKFNKDVAGIQIADIDFLRGWLTNYRIPPVAHSYIETKLFRSCFVSHSHKDELFVTRLVEALRDSGIRVWYAPEDLLPGKKIHEEVSKAIESFDRLLVVLSENSMESNWVRTEVRKARQRELRNSCRVLFPVSLVPFSKLRDWQLFDADTGQDLAVEMREYFIPDFSNWHVDKSFTEQVKLVIKGLRDA